MLLLIEMETAKKFQRRRRIIVRVPKGGKLQKTTILWMALLFIFLSQHSWMLSMNFLYLLTYNLCIMAFSEFFFLFFLLFKGIFCPLLPLCPSLPLNYFHSFECFQIPEEVIREANHISFRCWFIFC